MAVRQVTVGYSDGTHKTMPVRCDQTVLDAAEEHGVAIVNECQSGICGTCVATCTAGRYQMGRTEGLSDVERAARKILTCQTFVTSDCRIELQYPVDDNAALLVTGDGVVTAVELVSPSTAILRVDTSGMAGALRYRAGQFAQLQVPGTNVWRNYSYAHPADGRGECEFIIRLLPDGVMSNYLRDRAQPGDHIALRCSKGSFYLRPIVRPVILVAGGTGLSAILAMAQSLDADVAHPVYLLYGVERTEDLCKLDELTELRRRVGRLEVHVVVARPDPDWDGRTGLVTDLLDERMLASGDADVYLCGPVAMVDAARTWLDHNGFHRVGLYYEKFVASGAARRRTPARLDYAGVDIAEVCRRGRGTAVVIGGSIAGIAAAKMLSETFDRVIVLEKDGPHRRREGRPGAAQGWHLHHLLTAGQIELERIFPGIVDDMVREGAFKVDMPRSTVSGWAAPGRSPALVTSRSSAREGRCSNGVCAAGSTTNRASTSATNRRWPISPSTAPTMPSSASPWTMATPTEATVCRWCPPSSSWTRRARTPACRSSWSVSVLALPRPSRTSSTASTPRCSTGFRRSGGGRTR